MSESALRERYHRTAPRHGAVVGDTMITAILFDRELLQDNPDCRWIA
jgi:hypothetical protein